MFKWIEKLLSRNKIIEISVGSSYTIQSNDISNLPEWVINDVKEQIKREIDGNSKLSIRLNKYKYITATFGVTVPIGISIDILRIFYYDNNSLYSTMEDKKALDRNDKILKILN